MEHLWWLREQVSTLNKHFEILEKKIDRHWGEAIS